MELDEVKQAWANGAEIQFTCIRMGHWKDCNGEPSWFPEFQYRVRPKPDPEDIGKVHRKTGL